MRRLGAEFAAMKHTPIRALLAAILSLWLAAPAWAGFDEGVAAYKRGDYATAYEEFLSIAEQGDARVQGVLGAMYFEGVGVPQDYAEALKWLSLAAEQGVTNKRDRHATQTKTTLTASASYKRTLVTKLLTEKGCQIS